MRDVRPVTAAAALALLLVARAAAGGGARSGLARSECALLEESLRCAGAGADPAPLQVRWDNAPRDVFFYWDSAPSHAAAALLLVLLRHCLGYRGLHLLRMNTDHCRLDKRSDIVAVGVWTARPEECASEKFPLLGEAAAAGAAARLRLHARLAPAAPAYCAALARSWPFYLNQTHLRSCLFLGTGTDTRAKLYVTCRDCNRTISKFNDRARNVSLLVHVVDDPVNRTHLMLMMRDVNRSFLFIDHDMWQEYPLVQGVQPPPCTPAERLCADQDALDTTTGVLFANYQLQTYAPVLINVLRKLQLAPKYLREILEMEAYFNREIEETTCGWARNNSEKFDPMVKQAIVSSRPTYILLVVMCNHDSQIDYRDFNATNWIIYDELNNHTTEYGFVIDWDWYKIDCYSETEFSDLMLKRSGMVSWPRVMGVVARGEGAMAVARGERSMYLHGRERLPMALYDAAPARGSLRGAVWPVAGTVGHLAAALRRLLADAGWRRLAVLTDATHLARSLAAELARDARLTLRRAPLSPLSTLSPAAIAATLRELIDARAKIYFINAGAEEAAAVLKAAFVLRMTPERGYAWIVREWSGRSEAEMQAVRVTGGAMRHYTVSMWSRSGADLPAPASRSRRRLGRALDAGRAAGAGSAWSLRAAPWADAMLTLGYGFTAFYRDHSKYRYDIHSEDAVELFTKILNEAREDIPGFSRNDLPPAEDGNQTVYVDQWTRTRTRLTEWVVRGGVALDGPAAAPGPGGYLPPDLPADGLGACVARLGDPFTPTCLDFVWITALVSLPFLIVGMWAVRVRLRKRAARRREEREFARHGNNVTKLLSVVVNREDLEMREELGFGKSGRVNLAILRRACGPRAVAVKALRDDAAPSEESEFLREACTLASLEHDHVVRLVGVCVIGGPTLVLMEHAFFGDLLRYLRTRRHLAEGVGQRPDAPDPEAEHVTAEALTRLAREAASALGYLALRGVVHCDVRAANCLVDARRSLKLGDFGMARQTRAARADAGLAEYACRRRAMFPVLWMAPESLTRGVFSAATDVWALGVLVFELVTLGARPYGDWSPLRVLHYVHDGGRPALPLDASTQTRGLARACWRRAGEERPSAAAVVAYLAERPRALSPALQPPLPLQPASVDAALDPTDSDSGFGETPSPGPGPDGAHEPEFGASPPHPIPAW